MNQIHVRLGNKTTHHSSFYDALESIRLRLFVRRLDKLFEEEVIRFLRVIFLLEK